LSNPEEALLLSVRPQYAELILCGTKRAEIRRQRPSVQPGAPVIIYATLPVGAVIGSARVASLSHGTPPEIWAAHHAEMGISHEAFNEYLTGAASAHVLMLTDAQRLRLPITLHEMRRSSSFHPPHSYRFLSRSDLHAMVNGHPSGQSLLSLL
jgi:predicted transcriptional regulator